MQLYALDTKGKLINARQASKKTNYQCLECNQIIRLRGGPQRQCHFYHVDPIPFCRQHQKGPVHLQIQSYFFQQLPAGDCQLEYIFSSIGRIADVAWLSQKVVFEIQYSPISAEEVLARNYDYQQLGWQVVWILHDRRYNQTRLSAAEQALRSSPHYFTNMDQMGSGIIYDQFDICEKGLRLTKLPPLPINITEKESLIPFQKESYSLLLIQYRLSNWKLSFSGDLLNSFVNHSHVDYWNQAIKLEKLFYKSNQSFKWYRLPILIWQSGFVKPYRLFFRFLLERFCR